MFHSPHHGTSVILKRDLNIKTSTRPNGNMLRELVLLWLALVGGIITQNEVFLREPNHRGPLAIQSGIKCLHAVEMGWLKRNEILTRSSNLAIAYIQNDTYPAVRISEEYIKFKNEFATNSSSDTYLIRIFSSASEYNRLTGMLASILLIDYYVIITDDVNDIRFIIESYLHPAPSWNPGARFLVLYNDVTNKNNAVETAKIIFDILLKEFYIHKVILLYSVSTTNYSIHIFDPFDEQNCRTVVVENASSCDNGVINNPNAYIPFLKTYSSLRNCTLKLCTAIFQPFINPDCHSGLEMRILNILQGKLQFDVSFLFL